MQKLAFINGFRALAALWVVVAHSMIWAGWLGPPLPSAKLAVDLFIIISGYLMMHQAMERESFDSLSTGLGRLRFYVRRLFRIAPVYYLALACVVALAPFFLGGYQVLHDQHPALSHSGIYDPAYIDLTPYNVFLHVTFLFGLLPDYAFSTFLPDWSLGLEMQFYAVFPLLYLFAKRFGWYRMLFYLYFPCQFIISFCERLPGPRLAGSLFVEPSFLPLKLHYFMVGMVIARASADGMKRKELVGIWFATIAVSLDDWRLHGSPSLILTAFIVAFLSATTFRESWFRTALDRISSTTVVSFLSRMSYAAYLFHGFAIAGVGYFVFSRPEVAAMGYMARTSIMMAIVLPSTYAMSWLVERYVEVPGIALGRIVIQRVGATLHPRNEAS